MAASFLLAKIYYSQDVDFYEQAQLDSIRLQRVMDDMKSNGYDASGLSIKKVHRVRASFRPGGAAIMSRQLLEMQKKGPFVVMRELLNGAIYIVMGLALQFDFKILFGMLLFTMAMGAMSDGWNAELKKPYIYLIPESPFKKLIFAVLPGFLKVLASGVIVLTAAAILYGEKPLDIVCYLILMAVYTLLFEAAEVFTYRLLGRMTNIVTVTFLRMIFLILSAVPAGILALILYAITGSLELPVATFAMALANIAFSMLLLFLSRRIFEQCELMN
jgi:hypothetical protein